MKLGKSVMGLMGVALVSTSFGLNAASVYNGHNLFKWTGEGGYTAEGYVNYDNTMPLVSAYGLGDVSAGGIQSLSVSFFNPSHNLLYSVMDISNGISIYDFLNFTFDTSHFQIIGDLTNGRFNLGLDSVTGNFHVSGSIGADSNILNFNSDLIDIIQNNTQFSVIPEPSTLALFSLGLAALASRARKPAPK